MSTGKDREKYQKVIIQLICATTTDTGLTITCDIDQNIYPIGIEVSDAELVAVWIQRDTFQGDWNYTISPRLPPSP